MNSIPTVDYTNKVAFVTGAGSGIGRTTAIAFAKAGAAVTVADISEGGLKQTVAEIESFGGKVLSVICDVTKGADVKAALDRTIEVFGRLDAAFNNVYLSKELDQAELRIPRPDSGLYFIRVRATDADGYVGAFTATQKLNIFTRWTTSSGEPIQSGSGIVKPGF